MDQNQPLQKKFHRSKKKIHYDTNFHGLVMVTRGFVGIKNLIKIFLAVLQLCIFEIGIGMLRIGMLIAKSLYCLISFSFLRNIKETLGYLI